MVMFMTGCAGTLAPSSVSYNMQPCESVAANCHLLGQQRFDQYRQKKREEIQSRSHGYRLPGAPIARLHPMPTEYSVLLVHGLNDSAYYMSDLADLFYAHGFNAVTILLPGHGTDTRDMLQVSAEQWRSEVQQGLEMAHLVGRKVLLGGFSLGATLAIDAALSRSDIHGLLLFSPAVKLRSFNDLSALSCMPGLRSFTVKTKLIKNPVKYKYRVGNGVCQLSRLIKSNLANGESTNDEAVTFMERLRKMGQRLHIPTFVAVTYGDNRISPQAMLEWSGQIDAPVTITTFGQTEINDVSRLIKNGAEIVHISDENLPHSFLIRRNNRYNGQKNPYYDEMSEVIVRFLTQHFDAKPDNFAKDVRFSQNPEPLPEH